MIVKMTKYNFVLFHEQKDDFLNRLQDLGLVDITTTGWEPDEREREIMISIDKHRTAIDRLKLLSKEEDFEGGTPYSSPQEAYQEYVKASTEEDAINSEIDQLKKEAEELKVWGDFNPEDLRELTKSGVELRFFHSYSKEFETHLPGWSEQYNIVPINDYEGTTYFVVISSPGEEVLINAQEIKRPTSTFKDKEDEIRKLTEQKTQWSEELKRAAASIDLIEEDMNAEKEKLHFSQAERSGLDEAEGTLVLMEGWATNETAEKVDKMLELYPNLYYIKSAPTPDDEAPVLLKNGKFTSLFEIIGNFYSKPKYGSMDLTPFFGPFYVLFFGLCLADAGYGLIFLLAGAFLIKKVKPEMKGVMKLAMLCGISTMICGAFMGSFFGIEFTQYAPFAGFRKYILSPDNMFMLALVIGVVQILFAMILKVVNLTMQYGFKYSLSTLGWMLVLVSSLAAYFLPGMGYENFGLWSVPHLVLLGTGVFMMLFLNSPGKNPLVNLGSGLWATYNNITGIIGDILSYIRLFAIGLSGGILASVFNQLALGLSPDIPVVRQISIVIILLIGHGITLFMSSLSAFVHPMRLTFVEFYGNAGFEPTQREFNPLRRHGKN